MGDVRISLSIRKRLIELEQSSLLSQRNFGNALRKAGRLLEAEVALKDVVCETRKQWVMHTRTL